MNEKNISISSQEQISILWRRCLVAIMLFITVTGSGCASIVKSDGRKVTFESDPPGATVRMKGSVIGKTPCTKMIKGAPIIMMELEGYRPDATSFDGKIKMEPWVFGNFALLLFAPVGIIVDTCNDRMFRLESPYHVTFLKVGSQPNSLSSSSVFTFSQTPAKTDNSAVDRLKALKDLKDQGVISELEYETKRADLIKEL